MLPAMPSKKTISYGIVLKSGKEIEKVAPESDSLWVEIVWCAWIIFWVMAKPSPKPLFQLRLFLVGSIYTAQKVLFAHSGVVILSQRCRRTL